MLEGCFIDFVLGLLPVSASAVLVIRSFDRAALRCSRLGELLPRLNQRHVLVEGFMLCTFDLGFMSANIRTCPFALAQVALRDDA